MSKYAYPLNVASNRVPTIGEKNFTTEAMLGSCIGRLYHAITQINNTLAFEKENIPPKLQKFLETHVKALESVRLDLQAEKNKYPIQPMQPDAVRILEEIIEKQKNKKKCGEPCHLFLLCPDYTE